MKVVCCILLLVLSVPNNAVIVKLNKKEQTEELNPDKIMVRTCEDSNEETIEATTDDPMLANWYFENGFIKPKELTNDCRAMKFYCKECSSCVEDKLTNNNFFIKNYDMDQVWNYKEDVTLAKFKALENACASNEFPGCSWEAETSSSVGHCRKATVSESIEKWVLKNYGTSKNKLKARFRKAAKALMQDFFSYAQDLLKASISTQNEQHGEKLQILRKVRNVNNALLYRFKQKRPRPIEEKHCQSRNLVYKAGASLCMSEDEEIKSLFTSYFGEQFDYQVRESKLDSLTLQTPKKRSKKSKDKGL